MIARVFVPAFIAAVLAALLAWAAAEPPANLGDRIDPWVTRELTVRDLLVRRSGLGPGDLPFIAAANSAAR